MESCFSNKVKQEKKIPGGLPIWIFIFSELVEFALFFIVFLVVKVNFPTDFAQGVARLNINFAIMNTLFLITSSYFVAKSVRNLRNGKQKQSVYNLLVTLLLGFAYIITKLMEYKWNEAAGFDLRTNYFFTCYYYLTFNHLMHVAIAMFVLFVSLIQIILGIYNKDNYNGFEGAASYWHMIDLVWIILFPLLYVLV